MLFASEFSEALSELGWFAQPATPTPSRKDADERVRRTQSELRMLAVGLRAYEAENGALPVTTSADSLPDLLHPLFVPDLVRQDIWGSDFVYEHIENTFRLRSPGPDLQLETDDDLEVTADDFQ